MSILLAVLYGTIQGLTEFLPVSSSGHLCLAQNLFGLSGAEGCFTFDVLLHMGTLFAVFSVYGKDIRELFFSFFSLCGKLFRGKFKLSLCTEGERFVIMIFVATLPLLAAPFIKDRIELLMLRPRAVGAVLIINGAMLLISDKVSKGKRSVADMSLRDALTVGIFQLFASVPGLSRSGSTVTGALLCGEERSEAVRFSFLMSIPAIIGANIFSLPEMSREIIGTSEVVPYLFGTAAAFLSGLFAMRLLIYISKKSKFGYFAYYSIAIGTAALIFM